MLQSLEEAVPCIPAADLWRSGLRSTWLWRCCSSQLCGLQWELPPVLREGEERHRLWSQHSWWPNRVFTLSRDGPEAQKQSVKLHLNPWEMTHLTSEFEPFGPTSFGKYRKYIYVFPIKLAEGAQLDVSWLGRSVEVCRGDLTLFVTFTYKTRENNSLMSCGGKLFSSWWNSKETSSLQNTAADLRWRQVRQRLFNPKLQ